MCAPSRVFSVDAGVEPAMPNRVKHLSGLDRFRVRRRCVCARAAIAPTHVARAHEAERDARSTPDIKTRVIMNSFMNTHNT